MGFEHARLASSSTKDRFKKECMCENTCAMAYVEVDWQEVPLLPELSLQPKIDILFFGGGRGLFHVNIQVTVHDQEKSGKNLEAEVKQNPWRNTAYWFAPHGQLSYLTQDHEPRGGTTHSELGPATSFTSEESGPQTCPQASPVRFSPQLRLLLR